MNKTVLGRVQYLFAKRVDRGVRDMADTLPDGVSAQHTGNSVRASVLERAVPGYIAPVDYPMELW